MAAAYLLAGLSSIPPQFCSKVAYPSRPEAQRAIKKMRKGARSMVAHGKDGTLKPYRCGCCKLIHVAHL